MSIESSPSGVGDVQRWSSAQAALQALDLGMASSGRPSMFVGGAAQEAAHLGDVTSLVETEIFDSGFLAAPAASIDTGTLSTGFDHLRIYAEVRTTDTAEAVGLRMAMNGLSTTSDYRVAFDQGDDTAPSSGASDSNGIGVAIGTGGLTDSFAINLIEIFHYERTDRLKTARLARSSIRNAASRVVGNNSWQHKTATAAITDLQFTLDAGSFAIASRVQVFGVRGTRTTLTVEAHTSDDTLTAAEYGSIHTNEGAAATLVNLTLPTAEAGGRYLFTDANSGAGRFRITAGAGDTIRLAGDVSAAAGNILSTARGDAIELIAINSVEWIALPAITGTWTVT